jgi:hypothetical protein
MWLGGWWESLGILRRQVWQNRCVCGKLFWVTWDFLHVRRKRSPNLQMCSMCLLFAGFIGDSRRGTMGYICTISWSCIFLVLYFAILFVWLSSSSLGAISFHFVSRSLFSFLCVDMGVDVWDNLVFPRKSIEAHE